MATGYPDYRQNIDIASQSLSELNVDIIAQTLASMNVNIIAQTLANLKVDINAQTLAQLNIDIIAQSIGNIATDIVAQSVGNLQVDLVAQTLAQMNIDIIAQTIGNLNIDIAAQAIGELINRPKYGAAATAFTDTAVNPGALTEMVSITGTGMIYGVFNSVDGILDANADSIYPTIDSVIMNAQPFGNMFSRGYTKPNTNLWWLQKYDPVNFEYALVRGQGITFETSYKEIYSEALSRTPQCRTTVLYALI